MRADRIICQLAVGVLLTAPAFGDGTSSSLDGAALFGINRETGAMSRYDFADDQTSSIDTVRDEAGTALLGIDAAAYIPGHQNICAFWMDGSDNQNKLVYINTESAKGTVIADDLEGGRFTGAATVGPVQETATQFDGQNDYEELDHSDAFLLDNGTVMFWFMTDDLTGIRGLFSKDSSGYDTGGHLTFYIQSSHLLVRL